MLQSHRAGSNRKGLNVHSGMLLMAGDATSNGEGQKVKG
jgi:hypothetical protein